MKNLSIRLKAYKPNGDTLGLLPQPSSFSASFLHDDTGALRLEYSRKALNGSILERKLETGLEIAVEVSDGGKWTEPLNGRFVLISRSRDALDSSDTVTFTCPSYAWLLNKALMLDLNHLEGDGDDKGKRVFKKATAGLIMRTFLDENKTRGGIPVTCGFDTGKDSAGTVWKSIMTLAYTPGISSLTALANLASNKICDWAFDKRTLKIWNMDSTGLCRDLSRISVQLAHDVLEAPEEESIEALASHILVQGDNNKAFTRDNPAAPSPWGKWETYLSQQGISNDDTAALYMQSTLDTAARVHGQYTRALRVNDAPSLPLVDYRPGDWITAPTVMHGEKVRVQQVTLSLESNQFKASVVLNDKVYDATVRQAKRVQGITGGAINGGTGGGLPAPEKDHRTPKAVTGLVVQTDAYISSRGTALGLATLQWAQVSQATDNTAIDISSYRVEYRKNLAGAPWVSGGVTDAQRLTIGIGGLECGARYEFRVRAVPTYSDRLGEWSNVVVALVASDVTPPSIPSKPIPTSRYGIVDVQWDGRNNVNAGMEPDFDHCELGVSESNGNWQYRDSVARDGHCIVTGLTAYKTYWFALRSVDRSGNKSGWSAGVSVVVQSAVSPEEVEQIQQDLADNKTALKDNTAKLDQARKDIQANKSNLDAANQTLSQAQADLSQARKDIAQTKSDLTTANGEISKAKESAAQAYAEAHSKNHTFRGPDMPDASKGLIVGDLWLKTQEYWTRWQGEKNNSPSLLADFYTYWQGTPNNSPSVLVPLADRVIDTLVWDGSTWNHMGYADVENNAKQIEQAKSDIADNAAKTTDAKKAAENAAAAAKNAQGTADTANGAAKTAQDTANAATAAAKSATATAGQAKDAANAAQTAAESAKKTAGNAQTLANTANESANAAKSTAVNASSVATQAKATADSAAQSATDAANAAQKANTAAAAAAGVANGKADVLIQSTAPDASMRKQTTLWIDTTGGANTPKRWNGSTWMAVTDKAATDAANAAVKAHAAAQTAQSTADKAQTTAANAAAQANQAQAAAKKAQTTADGKNLIYRGPDEPAHDGLKPGDMWWRTQKYWTRWKGEKNASPSLLADFYTYWQGAPNNSPSVLVPLADRVVEVLTWDGTRFTPFDLVANNILAAGTVAAKHLAVDSVTAEKVKANAITVDKLAANSVTTEKLVTDAVTAAKLAANSVQARNIVSLAITTDKLAANSVTTAKLRVTEDMTVALLNVHKIQAGDIVAGAVTIDKLAANSVNADKLAANSVNADKIVSGAITTDKLAANSVTAVKIAAGTITSDKVAAGQFKGYVFTGAIFQSSEAANTGVKLNSTALQMWDSNHNRTVYLDGEGKSNVLTGTFQTRTSGHRVRISPDYRTHIIGGTETFVGDGLEFPAYNGSTAFYSCPAIASLIQSDQVGAMGELDLWSGRITQHDPAAFMRLRSRPREMGGTGSDGVTSTVYAFADTDYDEPDITKKSRAYLQLTGDANDGSSVWLEAEDRGGSVGIGTNIATGYLYLGGYLGGITNRCTFHGAAAWKAWWPNPGQSIPTGASAQVNCTFSPTKYGHYYVVANADSQWAGIIAHPVNTGGQSGFQLKLYNADQPCPVDVYAEYLAYLVK